MVNYGRGKNTKPIKKPNPKMARPDNTNGMTHGLMSIKMPPGWESDWVKEYRNIKNYYFGTKKKPGVIPKKEQSPIYDMVFKKLAYYSVKMDCAMVYMADKDILLDEEGWNFQEALNTYTNMFKKMLDQFMRYTHKLPPARDKHAEKDPKDMGDSQIDEELKRLTRQVAANDNKGTGAAMGKESP
jgi:hypothetical protein